MFFFVYFENLHQNTENYSKMWKGDSLEVSAVIFLNNFYLKKFSFIKKKTKKKKKKKQQKLILTRLSQNINLKKIKSRNFNEKKKSFI